MLNVETIVFMKMLEELCELSKNGYAPFSEAKSSTVHTKVFYDDTKEDEYGFPIPLMTLVDDDIDGCHHDVISYYESYIEQETEYRVRVCFDDDGEPSINIWFSNSDYEISIYNGKWRIIWGTYFS